MWAKSTSLSFLNSSAQETQLSVPDHGLCRVTNVSMYDENTRDVRAMQIRLEKGFDVTADVRAPRKVECDQPWCASLQGSISHTKRADSLNPMTCALGSFV